MTQAIFGLLGVIVGAFLAIAGDLYKGYKTKKESAKYTAMRLVGHLDEFAETCVDLARDNGTHWGQYIQPGPNEEPVAIAQVEEPKSLNYPDDLDWKSLDSDLMYRALTLPAKLGAANSYISHCAEFADPPDYDEVFKPRQDAFAELGKEAFEITALLRSAYGIPNRSKPSWNQDWDPERYLKERKPNYSQAKEPQNET